MLRFAGHCLYVAIVISAFATTTVGADNLLYRGTSEYGWSHRGVRSWGENWGVRAQNEALEQIRTKIAMMVNLKELDTFTKHDNGKEIKAAGSYKGGVITGNIGWSENKSGEERAKWLNENNFLIDVRNVRIKPGTDYSKTRKENGKRSWQASATMIYEYEIYGPERPKPPKKAAAKKAAAKKAAAKKAAAKKSPAKKPAATKQE